MPSQYWVQSRGELLGPFEVDELRRLAKTRKIRPDDKVSTDQKHWVIVSRVSGLMTLHIAPPAEPAPAGERDENVESAPAAPPVAGEEEYQLSPPEELPLRNPSAAVIEPVVKPLPEGSTHRLVTPDYSTAALVAAAFIGLSFFVVLPLSVWADAMWSGQEHRGQFMFLFLFGVFVVGIVMVSITALGSRSAIAIHVRPGGSARVSAVVRTAFVTRWRRQIDVGPGDRLEKQVTYRGIRSDRTIQPRELRLFNMSRDYFFGQRNDHLHDSYWFELVLITKDAQPLCLYAQRVDDCFATRHGAPQQAEEIAKLLHRAVPQLDVREISR